MFQLYLPRLVEGALPPAAPDPREPMPRGSGETVLVVEDNAALRRIVARQVRDLGYAPREAEDGPAALAQLAAAPVDLMFSDVVMPGGMDGFELAERVRAAYPMVKVLLTSGFAEERASSGRTLPAGLSLLHKPYRRIELARAISGALSGVPG